MKTATPPKGRDAQSESSASKMSRRRNSSERQYEEVAVIGNGAYGTVYKARDLRNEGQFVALKRIRLSNTEEGMPMTAIREISVLKQLEKYEHPNIVKLLDVSHNNITDREIRVNLVFEFIDQDLATYLAKCPSPGLGPDRIRDLMLQLLNGVDFLHSNRIVHRDLKPQNLLISRDGQLKLADFGLARIYSFHMALTTVVVTLWYRSPEVLMQSEYATSVDIWSCGCIFAELFNRRALFKGTSEFDQLKKIFGVIGLPPMCDWPDGVSVHHSSFGLTPPVPLQTLVPEMDPLAKDLMERMLVFRPGRRVSSRDALNHPYFRDDLDSIRTSSSLSTSENDSFSDGRSDTPVSK
ncbi:cyclin-dependent kinase 6-like [Littorina saxatilis]|uniref:cyclin-dependent kinase 6-like n=1 Tax=Littorina saxatilis TaxID=31220 RepID=UPI0038B67448